MQNAYWLSQKAKQLEDSSKGFQDRSRRGGGLNNIFLLLLPPLLVRDLENDDISLIVTQISSKVDEPVSDLKISKYFFFKSNHIAKNAKLPCKIYAICFH